jgi:hypothetical protein
MRFAKTIGFIVKKASLQKLEILGDVLTMHSLFGFFLFVWFEHLSDRDFKRSHLGEHGRIAEHQDGASHNRSEHTFSNPNIWFVLPRSKPCHLSFFKSSYQIIVLAHLTNSLVKTMTTGQRSSNHSRSRVAQPARRR